MQFPSLGKRSSEDLVVCRMNFYFCQNSKSNTSSSRQHMVLPQRSRSHFVTSTALFHVYLLQLAASKFRRKTCLHLKNGCECGSYDLQIESNQTARPGIFYSFISTDIFFYSFYTTSTAYKYNINQEQKSVETSSLVYCICFSCFQVLAIISDQKSIQFLINGSKSQ